MEEQKSLLETKQNKKAGKFRKILILWTKFGGKWERKGQFFSCSEGDR